jgi:hypothetical protein
MTLPEGDSKRIEVLERAVDELEQLIKGLETSASVRLQKDVRYLEGHLQNLEGTVRTLKLNMTLVAVAVLMTAIWMTLGLLR